MVHGIGQRLEKSNLVDDVGCFRHLTASIAERHLTSHQRGTQRVLYIPCQVSTMQSLFPILVYATKNNVKNIVNDCIEDWESKMLNGIIDTNLVNNLLYVFSDVNNPSCS